MITVRNLTKSFSGQKVLDGVDLDIEAGTIHALLGENGSGKSTLIKCLAGYHAPDHVDEISVDGKRVPLNDPRASMRAGMRFVHQSLGLVVEMTALENLNVASVLNRSPLSRPRDDRLSAARVFGRLGINVDLDKLVQDQSPLQRAGIAIARALDGESGEARLLVLDEPTAAMSPGELDDLFAAVRAVAEGGTAVLYVSHRLDEVLHLCDTATVLRDGVLQATVQVSSQDRRSFIELITGLEQVADLGDSVPYQPDELSSCAAIEFLTGRGLNGISFSVGKGEIVGFAGLDGSGRDTVAQTLAGAMKGRLRVTTQRGSKGPENATGELAKLGIVLALPTAAAESAVSEMSVEENVTLATLGSLRKRFGAVDKRRVREITESWMTQLDIRPRDPTKPIAELSGGNRQKVIIARALERKPELLALVDPTAGVDVGARQAIYRIMRFAATSGLGIVVASSDLEDLVSVCDRVLCMARGSIVAELRGEMIQERVILNHIVQEHSLSGSPI